ncbi:MAG: DUF4301 family protein [Bacteroidales bacterium]
MLTKKDIEQIEARGSNPDTVRDQIEIFRKGIDGIKLDRPAIVGDGIIRLDEKSLLVWIEKYEANSPNYTVVKFVPASGAATRMFKDAYSWLDKLNNGMLPENLVVEDSEAENFFTNIRQFAFWDDLAKILTEKGLDADLCFYKKQYKEILEALLSEEGLNYAALPKGLIKFHQYPGKGESRTPVEEHLVEGAMYARMLDGTVRIHFTVSPDHRDHFSKLTEELIPLYGKRYEVEYEVSFSLQKSSTDTIAVDLDNKPFRETDGSLLFRPGGHGALIENLNDLDGDFVFIKNIDNVVPDSLKEPTIIYKKVIGGLLIDFQKKIHEILRKIYENEFNKEDYPAVREFVIEQLNIDPVLIPKKYSEGIEILPNLLDRPIRVCGMVKNEGEPGGGPFWVRNSDNSCSLQIIEASQVHKDDPKQEKIFKKATHFNPVDLACGIKSWDGQQFDLKEFIDNNTYFISKKSKNGKDLKALELPGLWNGAMANWITVFVEVPLVTFNPVKTVNDLLRKEHRS